MTIHKFSVPRIRRIGMVVVFTAGIAVVVAAICNGDAPAAFEVLRFLWRIVRR